MTIYQALVKHLDGHTQCLQFSSQTLTGEALKQSLRLYQNPNLRLVSGTVEITDETLITASSPSNLFPSVALLVRLRGGKGGFGSLLRGAATKAGQKKTNNFDACRDMSGRRLRHVNAEKKLEEWKAEAEGRRLEKVAEEFLKKKAKEVKGKGKGKGKEGEVEKYLEKYREDSAKCMEAVEESVRESFGLYREGKRKVLPAVGGPSSKRLKIWMGKKKVDGSDSDDEDEDDDEEVKEKSVVLDDGNCTTHDEEDEGTSSVAVGCVANSDGESSDTVSEQSNLEELIGASPDGSSLSGASEDHKGEEDELHNFESPSMLHSFSNRESNSESRVPEEKVTGVTEAKIIVSASEEMTGLKEVMLAAEKPVDPEVIDRATVVQVNGSSSLEEPLDFNMYKSAAELEALGMERLKAELQSRGLKCGGTLQERAARLFILKTTPFDKLPKKVLAASKTGGGG